MQHKPYYLVIIAFLLLGLTSSTVQGVGGAGTITGGTFPACVDPATSTSTVKIAGKQVAPGGLVRIPTGSTCLSAETTLNLNSYIKTVLVSPGGDLRAAVNAATSGTMIKIEPGTYDLGVTTLTMKSGVDLEGSGEGLTTITSQVNGAAAIPNSGTITLASGSEVRFLTVANNAPGTVYRVAVYASGVNQTARLTNVTLTTAGGGNNLAMFCNNSAAPTIRNSTVSMNTNSTNNYGIYNKTGSAPNILDSTVTVSGGGFDYGIYNVSSSSPNILNSTITASGGSTANYGMFSDNSTPNIRNSDITVSGGNLTTTFGISNSNGSNATIQNINIEASGITNNTNNTNNGIFNDTGSFATIQDSNLNVTGGNSNNGMKNIASTVNVYNTVINAGGSSDNYGIVNNNGTTMTAQNLIINASGGSVTNTGIQNNSSTTTILNSLIKGAFFSIVNTGTSTTTVGSSQLGNVVSGPSITFNCLYTYLTNLTTVNANCV